jgi:proline racemase
MFVRNFLTCVDHHHGQASRTIIAGYPAIRGRTMGEKARHYVENMSWIHEAALCEPRGHRNLLGAILTEPVSAEAAYGILFLHPSGMFDGCGDSTFSAGTALVELGMVPAQEPVTRFGLDTVLGRLDIEVDVKDGIVQQIRFRNVASYYVGDFEVTLSDGRKLQVEVAFGGLYYGFIRAEQAGFPLTSQAETPIIGAAQMLWDAIGTATPLTDPQSGQQIEIDLFTFVEDQNATNGSHWIAANVYKPGRMGRTPSGTGSSAHIALRVAKGVHEPSEPFVQQSLLGTRFTGTAERHTLSGGHPCVHPTIAARSHMMSITQIVLDPADPFRHGFIVES